VAGSEGVLESLAGGTDVTMITQDQGPEKLLLPEPRNQFVDYVSALQEDREFGVPEQDCFRMTEIVLKLRDAAKRGLPADL
jgi:hypothetical protein